MKKKKPRQEDSSFRTNRACLRCPDVTLSLLRGTEPPAQSRHLSSFSDASRLIDKQIYFGSRPDSTSELFFGECLNLQNVKPWRNLIWRIALHITEIQIEFSHRCMAFVLKHKPNHVLLFASAAFCCFFVGQLESLWNSKLKGTETLFLCLLSELVCLCMFFCSGHDLQPDNAYSTVSVSTEDTLQSHFPAAARTLGSEDIHAKTQLSHGEKYPDPGGHCRFGWNPFVNLNSRSVSGWSSGVRRMVRVRRSCVTPKGPTPKAEQENR